MNADFLASAYDLQASPKRAEIVAASIHRAARVCHGIETVDPGAVASDIAPASQVERFLLSNLARPPRAATLYHVDLIRAGELIWSDDFANLVIIAGLNKLLDACFVTGLSAPAWYVGLVTSGALYAPADTMAAHPGWTEFADYSDATRPAFTPGAIALGSLDNTAARAVFHINKAGSVGGCFLADDGTIGKNTSTLYGVGSFSGGDRVVEDGDILRAAITLTIVPNALD